MTEQEETIFWELVGKRIAGEINKEEDIELNNMLKKNPELLYTLETIGYYWNAQKENTEHKDREAALEKHMLRMETLELINNNTGKKPVIKLFGKSIKMYRRFAVAAALTGFTLLSIFFFQSQEKIKIAAAVSPSTETIVALKGSKNHFVLPDGSTVWLNAGTTINYQSSFNTDSVREVFLTGEAYFEIRHNDKHPFWIHTSQVDIRDIGTSFNVKAYPSDTITEATLVEGSIQVKIKNGRAFTTLNHPHEKITVRSNLKNDSVLVKEKQDKPLKEDPVVQSVKVTTAISLVQEDSLLAETAWLKGMMIFRNESFEELAIRMERWYNVSISFEKPEYKKYRFSGTFNNETIEDALKELQVIKSFSFKIDGRNIIINN